MNKSKLPMPARLRKKMNKEIRSAMPEFEGNTSSNTINKKALLSRLPPKLRKKETAILNSFEKNFEIRKKKIHAKHSKRTNPRQIAEVSPPKIIHIEGGRWIRTLKKQTANQNKILNRKMTKKR
jgi:hypothetical protein